MINQNLNQPYNQFQPTGNASFDSLPQDEQLAQSKVSRLRRGMFISIICFSIAELIMLFIEYAAAFGGAYSHLPNLGTYKAYLLIDTFLLIGGSIFASFFARHKYIGYPPLPYMISIGAIIILNIVVVILLFVGLSGVTKTFKVISMVICKVVLEIFYIILLVKGKGPYGILPNA